MLARPEAEQSVATVIHEATHQIAFNSGLQTRFADIPLWVSEGLAVYLRNARSAKHSRLADDRRGQPAGWRSFAATCATRPTSLKTLIVDDTRIRDTRTALDAYAEAWALNYYLLRHHPREYVAYLQMLSEKKPLLWDTPEDRLREFQQAFGDDLGELDDAFLRYMQRVRGHVRDADVLGHSGFARLTKAAVSWPCTGHSQWRALR